MSDNTVETKHQKIGNRGRNMSQQSGNPDISGGGESKRLLDDTDHSSNTDQKLRTDQKFLGLVAYVNPNQRLMGFTIKHRGRNGYLTCWFLIHSYIFDLEGVSLQSDRSLSTCIASLLPYLLLCPCPESHKN